MELLPSCIGLDSFDSPYGGCTTHFTFLLLAKIVKGFREKIEFVDYPNLVRLNPNIPWKTRGNAAVVLRIRVEKSVLSEVIEVIKELAAAYMRAPSQAASDKRSQPGVAVYVGNPWSDRRLVWVYRKALTDVVTYDIVEGLIARGVIEVPPEFLGNRGLIGAVASLAALGPGEDFTYELIAYRRPENFGTKRRVDPGSVKLFDRMYSGCTFSNYDYEREETAVDPRGPDPVLYGLRGERPDVLVKGVEMIKVSEKIEGWVIYRTNQATDAHAVARSPCALRAYQTGLIRGVVEGPPMVIKGGHVIIKLGSGTCSIDVAAYQPSGFLRRIASMLRRGDVVRVLGGLKPARYGKVTFNAEKLWIDRLVPEVVVRNPLCPECGKSMKSSGRRGGYKCVRCGTTFAKNAKVIEVRVGDRVMPKVCTASARGIRHLVKPLERRRCAGATPPSRLQPDLFVYFDR